ncbi:MAG: hypothetical protein OT477_07470 [Chloroflexi bacterium]|nr:hypothetical protein [Chloroflexota bacterium]
MSEYMEFEVELDEDDPTVVYMTTNLRLTVDGITETYGSPEEMMVGSAVAQALGAAVIGLRQLTITPHALTLGRDLETAEHALVADVSAVLKDFFL